MRASLLALSLLLSSAAIAADDPPAGDVPSKDQKARRPPRSREDTAKASVAEDAQPVRRAIPFHGRTLAYTVTPGHVTIRNDEGEPIASMFYVAYTMPVGDGRPRPVTFLFNGGPGSSSMWLHLGSFGPMKVDASHAGDGAPGAVPDGRQPRHLARCQRPRVHRCADHRAVARARQGRDQGPRRRRP